MSNVINLSDYTKPVLKERLKLTANYLDGTVRGNTNFKGEDFKDRLQRIDASLKQINKFMTELHKPPSETAMTKTIAPEDQKKLREKERQEQNHILIKQLKREKEKKK
jgi:uncharacterized membrane protein YukC